MANDLQLRVLLGVIDKALGPLKKITQGSGDTAKALKAARERLKELNATQADASAWRTQRAALEQTSRAMAANQAKISELARSMAAAGPPTRAMTRDYQRAIRESQRLKQQHDSQSQAVQALRTRLAAAGIDTRNFREGERALRQQIEATNASISEQGRRLQDVNRKQQAMAKARGELDRAQRVAGGMAASGAAALGVGYAASRPLNAAVQAFAPNEDAATQLKASMMVADGSVPAEFQKITDLATRLGDKLPGTTADFQNMMTMLRRQGLSAQSVLGGTGEAAAYLGVQLKMPVEAAAEFAAKMQDATGTSEKDMMKLMDSIQRAYYLGVDPTNMLQGFSKIAPAMSILRKQGLEATDAFTPLLVMMDQAGLEGSAAGNAFRKIFQGSLNADKIKDVNEMFQLRGSKIRFDFSDGKGEFGGMEKLFAQLDQLKTLTTQDRLMVTKALFGDDSETNTTLEKLMEKGLAGYREVADKVKIQADLRTRVDSQLKTLSNVMEAAQGSWTNAMAELGATFAPELKSLISWLGEVANGVSAWARANPGLAKGVMLTVAAVAALFTVFGTLTVALAGFLGPLAVVRYGLAMFGIQGGSLFGLLRGLVGVLTGPLVAGIRAVSIALWGLAANPVVLAIAAVVAVLAGAAYLIYTHWDQVKSYLLGMWAEIKAGFDGGISGIVRLMLDFSPLGLFYRAFAGVMSYFGVELPGKFTEFGNMILDGLINGITSKLGAVKEAISQVGDSTITWFKEKLDIHSPSRVFAELGGFTMAGLAQGLLAGQGGPLGAITGIAARLAAAGSAAIGISAPVTAVGNRPATLADNAAQASPQRALAAKQDGLRGALTDFAARLTAAGALVVGTSTPAVAIDNRPPISAASPAPVIQGDTYQITIQAGPGTDTASLRRMLEQMLDERERAKAARVRSRLADRE
ncbi:phage tail tape measure protein [Pseudomonas aeruginosa]|uniref:phage tail tape measure protein n=1 Tax=Pseudomonas aeruginosa TaxID=287 RepID=UPI0021F24D14|nr:phage tail tape measure protein [Pseudomonas aeruginosa]MCV6429381.1 phage tail tape measure protein [Pseudomonas aeruginosa]MCV6437387.1 phage tail tape measure protein [Pseudomonas aeruginosa]